MEKTTRYTVYEYNEKASPNYRGSRFMTTYEENPTVNEKLNIVAENVSEDDAYALIKRAATDSADAFFNSLPGELQSNDLYHYLKRKIREGERGQ
jgi:hypothetical protein